MVNRFIYLLLFAAFGNIALASRLGLISFTDDFFKIHGEEYRSWFEHFLSGVAFPFGILFTSIIYNAFTSKWFRSSQRHKKQEADKGKLKTEGFLTFITITFIYVFACFCWEFIQFKSRSYFQWGQFSMDFIGALTFTLIATISASKSKSSV